MEIDPAKVRQYVEAYGVAVRAGVLTPNRDDEEFVRKVFGLPAMNQEVIQEWNRSDGIRTPITLAKGLQEVEPVPEDGEQAAEEDEQGEQPDEI